MDIFVDDGVGMDWFFISVPISSKDSISFDWTSKGHRVILQRIIENKKILTQKPTAEWDTIHISDGKLIKREHVKWCDRGEKDVVNGEIYETCGEEILDEGTAKELLNYSNIIRKHYNEFDKCADDLDNFAEFLKKLIKEYKKKFADSH